MISSTLIFAILSIAALDSINPSAIAMTFVILTNRNNPILKSALYTLAIYLTNLTLGIIVYLMYTYFGSGFKPDFSFVTQLIDKPPLWSLTVEILIGVILVFYTLKQGQKTTSNNQQESSRGELTIPKAFLLGIVITGVEASTALPYLGAISTIYINKIPTVTGLGILLVYNLIFVLPPTLILLSYILFQNKFASIIPKINKLVTNFGSQLFYVGSLILGTLMICDGILAIMGIKIY